MFNWFKKSEPAKPEVPELVATKVTPLPPPQDEVVYQVGKTEGGKITLRLGHGYSSGMLTMNDTGVYKLIDMLEAAIEGHNDTTRV
jgi:hypothetical protein